MGAVFIVEGKVYFLEIDIVPANEYNIKIEVFRIDFLDIENLRGNGIMERLLATQSEQREAVRGGIQTLEPKTDSEYILKDPYILEFLDLKQNTAYYENFFLVASPFVNRDLLDFITPHQRKPFSLICNEPEGYYQMEMNKYLTEKDITLNPYYESARALTVSIVIFEASQR